MKKLMLKITGPGFGSDPVNVYIKLDVSNPMWNKAVKEGKTITAEVPDSALWRGRVSADYWPFEFTEKKGDIHIDTVALAEAEIAKENEIEKANKKIDEKKAKETFKNEVKKN